MLLLLNASQTLKQAGTRIDAITEEFKRTIFTPIFFHFPILDKFPWIFRSRKRAFAILQELEDILFDIATKHPRILDEKNPVDIENETVAHRLTLAYKQGQLTEQQYRGNLKIIYLTGHENPEQLLTSLVWKLGTDQVSSLAVEAHDIERRLSVPFGIR